MGHSSSYQLMCAVPHMNKKVHKLFDKSNLEKKDVKILLETKRCIRKNDLKRDTIRG